MQDFARLALERVAAKVLVLFLDLAEARQDLVHVVGAIRIRHRLVEPFELVVQRADAAAAGNRFVEHAAAGHLLDVLSKVANGQALGNGDVPLVRCLFSRDHPEERGLAGAVRADEAHLFARIELERGIDEKDLPAVLLADSGEGDHGNAE